MVHLAHCRTWKDVAFYSGEGQFGRLRWRAVDRLEVQFRGHKGDLSQVGSALVRTRSEVTGKRSGRDADHGAIAFIVGFLYVRRYPKSRLSPRTGVGGSVRVWGDGQD